METNIYQRSFFIDISTSNYCSILELYIILQDFDQLTFLPMNDHILFYRKFQSYFGINTRTDQIDSYIEKSFLDSIRSVFRMRKIAGKSELLHTQKMSLNFIASHPFVAWPNSCYKSKLPTKQRNDIQFRIFY